MRIDRRKGSQVPSMSFPIREKSVKNYFVFGPVPFVGDFDSIRFDSMHSIEWIVLYRVVGMCNGVLCESHWFPVTVHPKHEPTNSNTTYSSFVGFLPCVPCPAVVEYGAWQINRDPK